MRELGIDIRQEFPKPLTDESVQAADVVITMGCGDACPVYAGKRYLNWDLTDPAGKTIEQIRPIRILPAPPASGVIGPAVVGPLLIGRCFAVVLGENSAAQEVLRL